MSTNLIQRPEDITPHKFENIDGWNEGLRNQKFFYAEEVAQIIQLALSIGRDKGAFEVCQGKMPKKVFTDYTTVKFRQMENIGINLRKQDA